MRVWVTRTLRFVTASVAMLCIALSATPSLVFAVQSVPYKMSFQGRLTNVAGTALTGTYDMQFKLYTAVTGGTFVWGETRTAANSNAVTVTNGLFSVLVGDGTAVAGSSASLQAAVAANTAMYMEVTVGAEVLSPRSQFGSSVYAFNSDTLDGLDSSAFAQASGNNTWTGTQLVKATSSTAFQVQNASGTSLFTADTQNSAVIVRSGADAKTLGAELYSGDFTTGWTTTGWTVATVNVTHNTGNTSSLVNNNVSIAPSSTYLVTFALSGTCGAVTDTLTVSVGGSATKVLTGVNCSGTYTYGFSTASAVGLTFAPSTNWTGTITGISIKQLTGANSAVQVVQNASGATSIEVRAGSNVSNMFMGTNSGASYASGSQNTAYGYNSASSLVSGQYNSSFGAYSLSSNVTGSNNSSFGQNSLNSNTTGNQNSALGTGSLQSNTTGANNTATGVNALNGNTTGANNTAVGHNSLKSNTTGGNNAAVGYNAQTNLTTGSSNASIGVNTLNGLTTGRYSSALGYNAGYQDFNGTFQTDANVQRSSALGAYAQVQANDAIVLGSVDYGTKVGIGTTIPGNLFSVSPLDYQTGTATRTNASATLTGTGTTWSAAMVGDTIIFADGTTNTVSAFTDATHITMGTTYAGTTDAAPVAYRFHRPGFQVTNLGEALIQTTSTTAFAVSSLSGNAVMSVNSSAMRVQIGSASGDTSAVLLVVDNSSQTTDPTGVAGGMYFNTSMGVFRCFDEGAWYNCVGSSTDRQRQLPVYSTDFIGSVGSTATSAPWFGAAVSAGTINAANAGLVTASHPGVVRLRCGTTTNGGYRYSTDIAQFLLGGGESYEAVFNPATFTGSTMQFGYIDTATVAESVDGAYFYLSGSGVVSGKASNNSIRSATASTYTLSTGTWYRARVVVTSTSRIDYYIYNDVGTLLWTDSVTTNIPTASGRETGSGFIATNTATTATDLTHLDYMAAWNGARLTR